MKLACALLLAAASAWAGPFDKLLKKAGEKAVEKGILTDDQAQGIGRTAKAFRRSAQEITPSEEHYIGRAVAAEVLSRYKAHPDPLLQGYVQAVGETVAMASDRPETYGGYHFLVLESEEVNALAAPGGFVFVTSGLVARTRSEDELAAVLAHETAHVARRHGLSTIKKARLTEAFGVLASEAGKAHGPKELKKLADSFEGVVGDVVKNLVVRGYSRGVEHEADRVGAAIAARAGYDPRALEAFIARLGETKGKLGWYKTHPSPSDRLRELRAAPVAPAPWHRPPSLRLARFRRAVSKL